MTYTDQQLSRLFRLRGLFRLLRIGILFRKFEVIRKKSAEKKKLSNRDIYHMSSPAEIVNEILCEIRDMIENDERLLGDINYCIKMISSGKLYETNFNEAENANDEKTKDAMNWVKSIQGNKNEGKRNSHEIREKIESKLDTIDIDEALSLNADSKTLLKDLTSIDFDIFAFKEVVEEKEMFVITSYLMHKHQLFSAMKMDPELFFKFITRIQDYYNPGYVEYHNKTHGTDVCQTTYFFMSECNLDKVCQVTDLEFGGIVI